MCHVIKYDFADNTHDARHARRAQVLPNLLVHIVRRNGYSDFGSRISHFNDFGRATDKNWERTTQVTPSVSAIPSLSVSDLPELRPCMFEDLTSLTTPGAPSVSVSIMSYVARTPFSQLLLSPA